jgi:hypothetical protein
MNHADPIECFDHAISTRAMSDNPSADNYAGDYMYMHSTNSHDHFKHVDTRNYLIIPSAGYEVDQ